MASGPKTVVTLQLDVIGQQRVKEANAELAKGGNYFKEISKAAQQANISFAQFNRVVSVSPIRDFSLKINGVTTVVRESALAVQGLDGQVKKLQLTMTQGTFGAQGKFIPQSLDKQQFVDLSSRGRDFSKKELAAAAPPPSFFQRLNPFGKDDQIDVAGLVKRAAITIPVWFAMRQAMQALTATVTEGAQRFIELDKAIAEMAGQTVNADNIVNFAEKAKKAIQDLSLETGESVQKIKDSYVALAETGINFETAFAGTEVAIKGAIATMSDSVQLARVLAGVWNNLGKTIKEGNTPTEKMQYIMGLMNVLFKENAGRVGEYIEALQNSASSAGIAGLSFKELMVHIVTLHTAMQRAGIAGTAVTRTLQELAQNREDFSIFLQRDVEDENINNYNTLLVEVVTKLRRLKDAGVDVAPSIEKMFGQRSQRLVKDMVENWQKYTDNVKLADSVTIDVAKQINLTEFNRQMDTIQKQLEVFKQVFGSLGEAFISGFVGTAGSVDALKEINTFLIAMIPSLREAGTEFKNFWNIVKPFIQTFIYLIKIFKDFTAILNNIPPFKFISDVHVVLLKKMADGVKIVSDSLDNFNKGAAERERVKFKYSGAIQPDKDTFPEAYAAGLSGKSDAEFRNFTVSEDRKISKDVNSDPDLLYEIFLFKMKRATYMAGLKERKHAFLDDFKTRTAEARKQAKEEADIAVDSTATSSTSPEKVSEFGKVLLDDFQKQLKSQGALTSEIIKQTELFIKQNNIHDTTLDKIKRQLELERALVDEKRLQSRLSADSMKLYDIAQKQGVEPAKEVSKVLSGETELRSFMNNASKEAIDAFTTNFADLWKQKQAEAFFTGASSFTPQSNIGLAASYGASTTGTGISIQEKFLQTGQLDTIGLNLQRSLEEAIAPNIAGLSDNTVAIRELTTALRNTNRTFISPSENSSSINMWQIEAMVAGQLEMPGTKINTALTNTLVGRDGGTL